MLAQLLFGSLVGFLLGIIGMHVNNALPFVSKFFSDIGISSMTGASYPSSLIPSYLIGIPDRNANINFLPGHRMAQKGKAIQAIKTSLLSSIIAILVCFIVFPFLLVYYQQLYSLLKNNMPYLLLVFSLLLILRSRNSFSSLLIFLVSGLFGVYVFNISSDPFFPLFSGFFAVPGLLFMGDKAIKQKDEPGKLYLMLSIIGAFIGMFAVVLPAINSPAQFSSFLTIFIALETMEFLALSSSISASVLFSSIIFYSSTGKPRQGFLAYLLDTNVNVVFVLFGFLFSLVAVYFLVNGLNRFKIRFDKLRVAMLFYLLLFSYILNGINGILILIVSSAIGLLALKIGAERINLMGSLIIPTILLFL